MFKGNSLTSFKSSKQKAEIVKVLEEQFETLGNVSVSSSGAIKIASSRFDGFGFETSIEGKFTERDGKFTITIDFEAKPKVIAWVIGFCFFPFGLAILIMPNNAKGEMNKKIDVALDEIKSELGEK